MAVGTMHVDGEILMKENINKGKAVIVMHMWQDHLWAMGSKETPPAPILTHTEQKSDASDAPPQQRQEASAADVLSIGNGEGAQAVIPEQNTTDNQPMPSSSTLEVHSSTTDGQPDAKPLTADGSILADNSSTD